MKNTKPLLTLLRVSMGWVFLWAYLDKLFGLGFSTTPEKSWLAGNSPTMGFLKSGTRGPLAQVFQSMAGQQVVDWLFMMGLLLIGVALILGIGMKIAAYSGSLMMSLMYLAAFPPKNNPLVDDHIIYILVLLLFLRVKPSSWYGLSQWWSKQSLVKKFPVLR